MTTPAEALQVKPELLQELRRLADRSGRAMDELAEEALREYVDYTGRFLASVEAGLRDAQAGRVYTVDEVRAELVRRRAQRMR